jgi:serine/threonine protein kinase
MLSNSSSRSKHLDENDYSSDGSFEEDFDGSSAESSSAEEDFDGSSAEYSSAEEDSDGSSSDGSSSDGSSSITFDPGFVFDKYEVINLLGSGTSASVYEVQNTETGQIMAFKFFNSNHTHICKKEIEFLKLLNGLRGVIEYTEEIKFVNGRRGFIMPFFNNGTLDSYIRKSSRSGLSFDEYYFFHLLKNLFEVVCNCVERLVCNCDIKPQNILVDDEFNSLIADFGLSKLLHRGSVKTKTAHEIYTCWFRGPMVYLTDRYSYSLLTELWALLISILYLASITRNPHDGNYYYRFASCPTFLVFRTQDYNRPNSQSRVDTAIESVFKKKKYSDFFKKWLNIEATKRMMENFHEESKNELVRTFCLNLDEILERPGESCAGGADD